ncbi:MAG: type II toxin-antitoxin system VapC family toxin [Parvibaculaceae bacterium]
MYLLDTNVISETRRARPHGAVLQWIEAAPSESLHLSTVSLGELQAGVEKVRSSDPEKASELEAWIDGLARSYSILSLGDDAFRLSARLMHRRPRHLVEDAMIAATALVKGLKVATRNVKDFEPFGVETVNPFAFA